MNDKCIYAQYYNDKETKDLRFDIYGYSPPLKLSIFLDNNLVAKTGLDFRTVERYQEYMEAGFNVLLMQTSGTYNGEEWETSDCKRVLDMAYEAGIDKVIVLDDRLMLPTLEKTGLIGEDKKFKNTEELEKYVADCLQTYKDHPAFYGVQIKDEPLSQQLEAVGQIYKAVKKFDKNIFVQCCLLPYVGMGPACHAYHGVDDGGDMAERYEAYLEAFLDATNADYIMYDQYPLQSDGTVFNRMYFLGMQIAGNVCKKRGVKFYYVIQAFSMLLNGEKCLRLPDQDEMFYQLNAVLGFGVKQFAYYTYWSGSSVRLNGEMRPDGGAMMTRRGEKTPLYGYVQTVNAMAQKLAPVLMNFEYSSDRYVMKMPFKTHPFHLYFTRRGKLEKVIKAETDQEVALINELYDKNKGQYLYKIQNITYNYYEKQLGLGKQTTTVTFAPEYTKVDVFDGEEWKTVALEDGKYTVELAAGYAVYLLPY